MRKNLVILCFVVVAVLSCKKDSVENPYDSIIRVENDNPSVDDLPIGNFAWLHGKIFKPTCANAGCHDGTFEPEFNSIASSYNSLVNHPVISNDETFSFTYRVTPGNASTSLLHERMTVFIPNTSGVMPLETDDDSDYPANEAFYIEQIVLWIEGGAQDMFGNAAPGTDTDFPPTIDGLAVFPEGNTTTPYERDEEGEGITPILVDAAQIDVWIRASDDNTTSQNIGGSIKVSASLTDFTGVPEYSYSTASSFDGLDFTDNPVTFYHKATIDLSTAVSGEVYFLRSYLDDGVQLEAVEIPNEGSSDFIQALFVLEIL
jgi:hypothetical protein